MSLHSPLHMSCTCPVAIPGVAGVKRIIDYFEHCFGYLFVLGRKIKMREVPPATPETWIWFTWVLLTFFNPPGAGSTLQSTPDAVQAFTTPMQLMIKREVRFA